MNTNRQNNNRRRGRNNNNRSQNNNNRSGVDYQNRIDNRARGNAAQMLEKYKKLASDAQLNGDRVNAEYYLQFADHYFRVLADFRSRQEERQEEQRRSRGEWQNEDGDDAEATETTEGEDSSEAEGDSEADSNEREPRNNNRQRRERSNNRPRRHHSEEAAEESNDSDGIDLAILPPSIGVSADEGDDEPVELAAKPARKPRTRRPARSDNDDAVVDAAE